VGSQVKYKQSEWRIYEEVKAVFVKYYLVVSIAFLGAALLSLILMIYYSANNDKHLSDRNLSASGGFTASALILIWKGREWEGEDDRT
jgi:hypothetical protein